MSSLYSQDEQPPQTPTFDLEALETQSNEQTEEPLQAAELKRNRTIATIVHFVLTYPSWSISLFLFLASVTTPLPTFSEQVTKPFAHLRTIVQAEAESYHQCVTTGFEWQDSKIDRVVLGEQERVNEQRSLRQAAVTNAVDTAETCRVSARSTQRSLQQWDALGLEVPKKFNATFENMCSVEHQNKLAEILQEDLTVIQDSIGSILDAYIANSLSTLRNVIEYSGDRSTYDYNYFVGVKIEGVVSVLDHFATPNLLLELPEISLMLDLRDILQGLLDALQGAYVRVDLLSLRITEFEASIQAFYLNYVDLYGRFAKIGNFVGDFLPSGVKLPNFFDISGIPIGSMLLPPVFALPTFGGSLPDIDDLVSDYLRRAVEVIAAVLEKAAQEATEQSRQLTEELIELLRSLLTLEDYNPPNYNSGKEKEMVEQEVERMDDISGETKTKVNEALDQLKTLSNDAESHVPINPDLGGVDPPTLLENEETRFSFLNVGIPEITIPLWIISLVGFLSAQTLLIEGLTQAVRLYRLKCKYEANTTPDLPEIDYVREREDSSENSKPSKIEIAKNLLLQYMSNTWVIVGLLFIPFTLCVLVFWFPHVKATCIDSRNGTFLARNILTQLQVNKANAQGHALHSLTQQQCHRRQRDICTRKSTESDAAYRSDIAALFAIQKRVNESIGIRTVLSRCVDINTMDEQFNLNCCGLEGYSQGECSAEQSRDMCIIDTTTTPHEAYQPMGETLLNPVCDADFSLLEQGDTPFDCSVLEDTCNEAPCGGVDADLIEEMTIDVDCGAEIYLIQVCMFLVLAVFHAIMINLANGLLFNGLLQLYWKKLNPKGIKMKTQVGDDGELMKGSDAQERTVRVQKAMKKFEMLGRLQIVLSGAVLVVWVVAFAVLKRVMDWSIYHE